jgi:hypothetical protein
MLLNSVAVTDLDFTDTLSLLSMIDLSKRAALHLHMSIQKVVNKLKHTVESGVIYTLYLASALKGVYDISVLGN